MCVCGPVEPNSAGQRNAIMSRSDPLYMPYGLFDIGEQRLAAFNSLFAPNAVEYPVQANPIIPNQNIWGFGPNYQNELPLDFDALATNCAQNKAATFTTEAPINSEPNEHGEEAPPQDDILDIIATQYGQDERLSKLETTVQKLVQASPKFPKELTEIPRQFTEVQSNLEVYLRRLMGWTNDQARTIEELVAKVESTAQMEKRVESLEAEVEALRDLIYSRK